MKQRIITGGIGIIVLLFIVWLGGIPYSIFITLLATIGFYEYLKINKTKILSIEAILGILSVVIIVYTYNYLIEIEIMTIIIILLILYLLLMIFKKNMITIENIGYYLLGVIYLGFSFAFMLETRLIDNGLYLTLFIFFITWASDSGAYFIGKKFGKKKLLPEISPKKTVEGSIGGIFFSIIVGLISNYYFNIDDNWFFIITIAILISIIGQFGDLIESALKRSKGVKDSGTILPGHGGILDRFDSLIFIFLVMYLIQIF